LLLCGSGASIKDKPLSRARDYHTVLCDLRVCLQGAIANAQTTHVCLSKKDAVERFFMLNKADITYDTTMTTQSHHVAPAKCGQNHSKARECRRLPFGWQISQRPSFFRDSESGRPSNSREATETTQASQVESTTRVLSKITAMHAEFVIQSTCVNATRICAGRVVRDGGARRITECDECAPPPLALTWMNHAKGWIIGTRRVRTNERVFCFELWNAAIFIAGGFEGRSRLRVLFEP
jgi:hypothetical protein